MYKISWVAKESRPEASGFASILAQHLKAPTVSDVLIANRVVKFLRSSASQCLTIWRHDPRNLRVISVSDAGGIGGPPTENGENVQNAHLTMVADDGVRQGVRVSVLSTQRLREKRSRCLRPLADAEWAQIMIQDILDQTVTVRDKTGGNLPFQVVLRSNCTLSKRLPHDHSIDAKSVLDALIKECAGNRQDRRTAVDLAIVRETLMVTAHEADLLYMRNFLEEITKNKYNQGGLTLKDLKPDTFESNEKSKLSFRQWSDEFSSWVERIDQDFEKLLRLAAQMQEWDKDKFIAEAQQDNRLGAEKVAEFVNTSTLR